MYKYVRLGEDEFMKKRVGFLIMDIGNGGGTERVTTLLANKLALEDYQVSIISCREGKRSHFFLEDMVSLCSLEGEKISNGLKRKILCINKLKKIIREQKIQTMIAVDVALYAYLWPLQMQNLCRCIAWEHFNYYISVNTMAKLGRTLAAKFANHIVVLGQNDLKNYQEHYKTIKNISCIYNPISIQAKEKADLNQKTIVSAGRFEYQKGFDLLIQIWEKVEKKNQDWVLKIYGDGSLKNELEKMIVEKNLHNIYLCGYADNIEKVYSEASVFALSSRYEGFGLVLLEAQATGLPCISFNCKEGPREIIKNGVNGFLIEEGNLDAYAEGLLKLMEDIELRKKFAEEAGNDLKKYEIDDIIKSWRVIL